MIRQAIINRPRLGFLQMLVPLLLAISAIPGSALGTVTIDFDSLSLSGAGTTTGASGSYWNGADSSGGFTTQGLNFNNTYVDYGYGYYGWDGWAYSNVNDVSTAGIDNRHAAYTGTDMSGTGIYAVGCVGNPLFGGNSPIITIPDGMQIQSAMFTNTTYAALSMLQGDYFAKKFGTIVDPVTGQVTNETDGPDWFLLSITGKDASGNTLGTVDFYLADYRFEDNSFDYIVNSWQSVDLSSLAASKTLTFNVTSSDNNDFGIVTPAFFAIDNLNFLGSPPAVWSGISSEQWSDASNWASGAVPTAGQSLLFNTTAGGTSNNDNSSASEVEGILFGASAGSFTLTGSAVRLKNNITNLSPNLQTVDLPLVLDGNDRSVITASGDITISKPISQDGGSFGIEKVGTHTLTLAAVNTYTGPTKVSEGTLLLAANGDISPDSAISVAAGATLEIEGGDHVLGTIDGLGTTIVDSGATLTATSITQDTLIIGSSSLAAVPEPGTFMLLLFGVTGTFFARKKFFRG